MSIGGGVHMAIERGCSIKCTAMQIFVKNNMQWFARPLTPDEIRAFLEHPFQQSDPSALTPGKLTFRLGIQSPKNLNLQPRPFR